MAPPGLALLFMLGILTAAKAPSATVPAAIRRTRTRLALGRLQTNYDSLPLSFEPNRGQTGTKVKFLTHAPHYTLFLTNRGAVISPSSCGRKSGSIPCWVQMELPGARSKAPIRGLHLLPGKSNYFIGNDPRAWRRGIPHFGRVAYKGLYPGIDLIYYGNPKELEFDFFVQPRADAARIQLSFAGAQGPASLRLGANGDLEIETAGAPFHFLKPTAFQEIRSGERRPVPSRYVLDGRGRIHLHVGVYDHSKPLIIDPALVYSTYLGGNGGDAMTGIAVDGSGNAYVTGGTGSTNFPTASPEQKAIAGTSNVFITELNSTGTGLVYSTFVGGSTYDKGTGIALDTEGNAYVTGYTSSPNFPATSGAYQTAYKGSGKSEAFVLELNAGGAALGYATYLGGSNGDFGWGIAVDSGGNAYVTGSTQSTDFPVVNPLQNSLGGGSDAFVAKLNPQGSALVYSTFLGGSQSDTGQAIALDGAGEATVVGYTLSADFPTKSPIQPAYGGAGDAFVARLNAAGSALLYSTYLGGSGEDRALGVAVDGAGDAYVTGSTQSSNFPVTQGAYQTIMGGGTDAFVAELNSAGSKMLYSTLLGGSANDQGNAIALDPAGNAYVTGSTSSPNFPVLNPSQATLGEGACSSTCFNAFVSVINPQGSGLVYSTYLGGNGPDYGQGIVADSSGNAYVAGTTASSIFPATGGAFQAAYGGAGTSGNGFVAKITPTDTPALAVNPQSINFGNQALGTTSAAETVTLTNVSSSPVSLSGVTFTDSEFAQAPQGSTCGSSLAAGGAQCAISLTFTPSSSASTTTAITASMSVNDNAPGNPQKVAVSGTGATPASGMTFLPSALTFPNPVLVGNSAGPLPVTLTNSGTASLAVTAIAISGSFTETNNCVTTLQPSASCTIEVTFSPTSTTGASTSSSSTASNSGSITVTSNFSGTAPAATVSGTADPDFSLTSTGPTGITLVSATSATLTLGVTALLSSFTGSITPSCSSAVTCTFNPATFTPGQTTQMIVASFTGTATNPVTFTLTGTSGAQAATLDESIPLQTFTLAATPPLNTIAAGQTGTYTVTVSSVNGFNLPVALTCPSGLPTNATCSFSPGSVTPAPGSPASSVLTVTTAAHIGSSHVVPVSGRKPPPHGADGLLAYFTLLIMIAGLTVAFSLRGRRRAWLMLGAGLLLAVLLAGCNAGYYGFLGGNPAPTGSPSGVYTVTVAGTYTPASGTTGQTATTESTTVNLAVQ